MTHLERLRAMSAEEIGEYCDDMVTCNFCPAHTPGYGCQYGDGCKTAWADWLNSEADDDGTAGA